MTVTDVPAPGALTASEIPARAARAAPTRAQLRNDWFLGGALSAVMVLTVVLIYIANYGILDEEQNLGLMLLFSLLMTMPLVLRRRFPITVAVIVNAAYIVGVELNAMETLVSQVAMFCSIYTIGAWVTDRALAMRARVVLLVVMFVWLVIGTFRTATAPIPEAWEGYVGVLTPALAVMLITWIVNIGYYGAAYYSGDRAYESALSRQALAERTAELEEEQELSSAQAVSLDRVRIARELHDVVAHHVASMGVQAGAARTVVDANPEGAKQALAVVEESARQAVTEMHRLLDTLRDESQKSEEAPSTVGLESLPQLVRSMTASGVPARMQVIGDPVEVSAFAQVNLYRIAQEALANARRHGGPDVTADVRLRYSDDAVELEVTNTGRVALGARAGLGTLGMRERATAMGGALENGPRDGGGFLVRVRVPLDRMAS